MGCGGRCRCFGEADRILPPLRGGRCLFGYPGVSLRATPWLPAGIPPGCGPAPSGTTPRTPFETPEYPEWIWTAMSQGAGNEMITCVETASYGAVLAAGANAGRHIQSFEKGAPHVGLYSWGGPLVCRFQGPPAPWNPDPSVPPMLVRHAGPQPAGRRPAYPGSHPHSEMRHLEVAVVLPWPNRVLAAGHEQGGIRRASSSPFGCHGAGQRTWCQVRVLASVEIPECPEWGFAIDAEATDWEGIMSVKTLIYPRISRPDRDSVVGRGYRRGFEAADLGVCGKWNGLCHPAGVVIAFLWLPGVSRGDTPGYSKGIPSGCAVAGMPTWQASWSDFVLEDIGGELLMSRDCPEIRVGADGCEDGVKAVEGNSKPWLDYRSPRGRRASLGTSPRGEPGGQWVGGHAENGEMGVRVRLAR